LYSWLAQLALVPVQYRQYRGVRWFHPEFVVTFLIMVVCVCVIVAAQALVVLVYRPRESRGWFGGLWAALWALWAGWVAGVVPGLAAGLMAGLVVGLWPAARAASRAGLKEEYGKFIDNSRPLGEAIDFQSSGGSPSGQRPGK